MSARYVKRQSSSIHPLPSAYPGSGFGHPQQHFPALLRDPKMFPDQMGYIIPLTSFGYTTGPLASWATLEDLQRNNSWGHLNHLIRSFSICRLVFMTTFMLGWQTTTIHYKADSWRCNSLPVHLIHFLIATKYLSSSSWGSNFPPNPVREQFALFWQRTLVSDLEVWILIPAISHSAANPFSAHWRS